MNRYILILTLLLLSTSGKAAVISGQILHFTSKDGLNRIQFAIPDYVSTTWELFYTPLQPDGSFHIALPLFETTEIKLILSEKNQSLILHPDDSINLLLDHEEWMYYGGQSLALQGPSAARQYKLIQIQEVYSRTFSEPTPNEMKSWKPEQAIEYLKNRHLEELRFWRSWELSDPLLREYADHQAFFSPTKLYLQYANHSIVNHPNGAPSKNFFSFWSSVLRQQRILLHSFALHELFSSYLTHLTFTSPTLHPDQLSSESNRQEKIVPLESIHLLKTDLTNTMRDRLLAVQMGNAMNVPQGLNRLDTSFAQFIETNFLRQKVLDKYATITQEGATLMPSIRKLNLPDSFASLTRFLHQQIPDQTIVVNFWGTWCNSCIHALQEQLGPMLNQYKSEDIVFVFVAVSSPYIHWVKTVNSLPYHAFHIHTQTKHNDLLRQEFKWNGLPQYTIINKSGNLIHIKAQSPDQGLAEQIDALK